MLKNLFLLFFISVLLISCVSNSRKHHEGSLQAVNLTDSAKFMKHVDNLPKVKFPEEAANSNFQQFNINLKEFKGKKLFDIPFKLNPRSIGGGGIDGEDRDSTFSLCDTSYKGYWELVAKTPKFIVVEVDWGYLKLVTIDYHLKVIDAMNIVAGDPASNSNFQADLTATIYKNLKVVMHYSYYLRTDEKGNFETTREDDIWRIDDQGHFKVVERSNRPEDN